MKILIFLLFPLLVNSQDSLLYNHFPMIEGRVNYTKVFNADSLTKDQLFFRIKDWAVNSYGSEKATLEADDKDAGYIAYKGYFPTVHLYDAGIFKGKPYEVDLYHTLKFYIKDNKVKIVLTDLQSLSKDGASAILGIVEKRPVESWTQDIAKAGKKRKEKMITYYQKQAEAMNLQIIQLLDSIIAFVNKNNSEFDF